MKLRIGKMLANMRDPNTKYPVDLSGPQTSSEEMDEFRAKYDFASKKQRY